MTESAREFDSESAHPMVKEVMERSQQNLLKCYQ